MTDPATGLPADNMTGPVTARSGPGYTSPTNIGGYLWSTVVARDTGIIGRTEAYARIAGPCRRCPPWTGTARAACSTTGTRRRTGAKLTVWPPDGSVVHPFLSSCGQRLARDRADGGGQGGAAAAPAGGRAARPMDFGFFYNPASARDGVDAGFDRGGFWDADPGGCTVVDNYRHRGPDVWYTCNSYDTAVTEARIALYVGIARGQIPAKAYYATGAPSRRPATGPGRSSSRSA